MSGLLQIKIPITQTTQFDTLLELELKLSVGLPPPHQLGEHKLDVDALLIQISTPLPEQACEQFYALTGLDQNIDLQIRYKAVNSNSFNLLALNT
jgi:hypothetical protein